MRALGARPLPALEKFYQSANCQAEAAYFAAGPDAGPRHIQVQLSGSFADAEEPFRDKPCYPLIWRSSVGNLLRAWELGVADRDEFLTRLRNDILADIARRNFPDGPPPAGAKRGAEPGARSKRSEIASALAGSATDTRFEDVIDRDKTEPPAVTREEGSGETESAVELLADWACTDSAGNRIFALLGSFGAGKTTASQLFVRELLRRREADPARTPVPVYLDFRRLNEVYLDEKTRPTLAEMIRSSLRSDVKNRIDAEQLLAFLRREPCVVVFDGLDEIGTRIGLERLAGLYRELLEIVPNAVWEKDAKAGEADWKACPAANSRHLPDPLLQDPCRAGEHARRPRPSCRAQGRSEGRSRAHHLYGALHARADPFLFHQGAWRGGRRARLAIRFADR